MVVELKPAAGLHRKVPVETIAPAPGTVPCSPITICMFGKPIAAVVVGVAIAQSAADR